jgi:hypothetical protein
MNKARIDKHGRLVLTRGKEELIAKCNVAGLSTIRTGWRSYMPSSFHCNHTCPGWKEARAANELCQDEMGENYLKLIPHTVSLCAPMDVTYEIVEDERGEER